MNYYVVGDLHGEFGALNKLINKKHPDGILACGDFGWFPHWHGKRISELDYDRRRFNQYALKNKECVVHWCDGNHEHHEDIQNRLKIDPDGPHEFVGPNVFYHRRGSVLTLPDGRTVLFFGGADSIDKHKRVEGSDWWRDELPTMRDFRYMEEVVASLNKKIDIVVSHTAPAVFIEELGKARHSGKVKDSTIDFLNFILEEYRPSLWYFGHFHQYKTGFTKSCRWTCLHYAVNSGWFTKLLEK